MPQIDFDKLSALLGASSGNKEAGSEEGGFLWGALSDLFGNHACNSLIDASFEDEACSALKNDTFGDDEDMDLMDALLKKDAEIEPEAAEHDEGMCDAEIDMGSLKVAGLAVAMALDPHMRNELHPPMSASGELSPLKRCKSSHRDTSCPCGSSSPHPGKCRGSPPPAIGTAMIDGKSDLVSPTPMLPHASMGSPARLATTPATANAFGGQEPSAAVPSQRPGARPTRQRSFSASAAQTGGGAFNFNCAQGSPPSLPTSSSTALLSPKTPSLAPPGSSVAPLMSSALLKSQPDAAARMARLAAEVEAKARMPEDMWAPEGWGGDPSGSARGIPPPAFTGVTATKNPPASTGPRATPSQGSTCSTCRGNCTGKVCPACSVCHGAKWAKQYMEPTPPRARKKYRSGGRHE